MGLAADLALLFHRDLPRLLQQIEAFPDDEILWRTCPGVTNPAGNLVLHLEGNLREYIGRQLGGAAYNRKRDLEFSSKGPPKQDLTRRIAELRELIPGIVATLSSEQMQSAYPEVVLEAPLSTQAFLIHLHGHLNWHMGQIDYLRRTLSGHGAIRAAGLPAD
ncbi:MAG TPA: DinB family protein [Bryobacteraceae bacterium]|nr:DinB family protein [Bryobacteraceae bacterium]